MRWAASSLSMVLQSLDHYIRRGSVAAPYPGPEVTYHQRPVYLQSAVHATAVVGL